MALQFRTTCLHNYIYESELNGSLTIFVLVPHVPGFSDDDTLNQTVNAIIRGKEKDRGFRCQSFVFLSEGFGLSL